MAEISIIVSAIAGMGSFFSPCILPILPAFISYLSGTTLHEIGNISDRKTSMNKENSEITTTTTTTILLLLLLLLTIIKRLYLCKNLLELIYS